MSVALKGLPELITEMASAPQPYRPSPFWEELAAVGLKQLENVGFENFKRTVNMTYFCWDLIGILRQQMPVIGGWLAHPRWRVFRARFPNRTSLKPKKVIYYSPPNFRVPIPEVTSFNALSGWCYQTYVAMLWDKVAAHDPLKLLSRIAEPEIGNPFLIEYQGSKTSQDVCNSVHEFYSAGGAAAISKDKWSVAEIGSGYGRLAYVWLQALPACQYCLIDIFPALNIAQEYFSRVFPNERIFYFRPFRSYGEIREEFEASRIRFLAAHQIELLPPKQFDLFINISSLHEMTYEQIERYLSQIDRLCRGRFYMKQWRRSQAPINGLTIGEHEYPIPPGWKQIYGAKHPIQRMFFHALYDVAPRPLTSAGGS